MVGVEGFGRSPPPAGGPGQPGSSGLSPPEEGGNPLTSASRNEATESQAINLLSSRADISNNHGSSAAAIERFSAALRDKTVAPRDRLEALCAKHISMTPPHTIGPGRTRCQAKRSSPVQPSFPPPSTCSPSPPPHPP